MSQSKRNFPVRVGILGGGQLARMLALSCYELGAVPHIYASRSTDCATQVTQKVAYADGSDETLKAFIGQVELLVIENEFIDLDQLDRCLGHRTAPGQCPMIPSVNVLRLVQSKLDQKKTLKKREIASLPFEEVSCPKDVARASLAFGSALVIKTARFGYDGKGTFIFAKGVDPRAFFEAHPDFRGYAEPLVDFRRELAVIVARGRNGTVRAFPVVESKQMGGICYSTKTPAAVSAASARKAERLAIQVISGVGGTGVFGVEMFELKDGKIVVNEIAPRVHNTGHYTLNTCTVNQFEQHLRCAMDLPLARPRLISGGAAMVNILGSPGTSEIVEARSFEADANSLKKAVVKDGENYWIHWYGKTGPAAGRKIGHINAAAKTSKRALEIAEKVRRALKI